MKADFRAAPASEPCRAGFEASPRGNAPGLEGAGRSWGIVRGRARRGKTDVRYWRGRLFKRTTDDWWARMFHAGREDKFNLRSPNIEKAAEAARDIYLSLVANGWEKTLAAYKPVEPEVVARSVCPTVGELLAAVEAVADIKPSTFISYSRKFRTLVAGVLGVRGGKKKFDYVHKGAERWRGKIDPVKLDRLDPEGIQKWRLAQLKKAPDPLARKQRAVTLNSILRSSKSLFAPKVLELLPKEMREALPDPFKGIRIKSTFGGRYKSRINAPLLAQLAAQELKGPHPEQYLAFLLALGAGLRRSEIDSLAWEQVDFPGNKIHVEVTKAGDVKTQDSEGTVDIDPGLSAILREAMAGSKSAFVINSEVEPRPEAAWPHYRCQKVFRDLASWLRAKGVSSRTPIHDLRKEFGSLLTAQAGIFVASTALRHSSITVTRDYYADKKAPAALDMTKILKAG